jgi:hypothetical protein
MEKIRPSMNALKAGVYSRDAVLPWESRAEYEKHCAEIFADLQPRGKIQCDLGACPFSRQLRNRGE